MIHFIGTGSAFNTRLGNTSAYILDHQSMVLIDCGGSVFHQLRELKLLDELAQLDIIITHTHPDHIGSLGEVVFYAHYVLKITPRIYFPDMELLNKFFACIGVESNMYELVAETKTVIDTGFGNLELSFMPVSHVPVIPAYGFILTSKDSRIYYSGDTNDIPIDIVNMLADGELDYLYQDTCGLDYDGNVHLSFRKLCEIIPSELRDKVICIHHDSSLDLQMVQNEGFQFAV